MGNGPDAELRARREATIQEHIAAENRRDAEATLATMFEAHYDVVPWGIVIDGREEVREFLEGYFTMMPAIVTEATRFYHSDDALIVETRTVGTHEGEIEGIPANGRPVRGQRHRHLHLRRRQAARREGDLRHAGAHPPDPTRVGTGLNTGPDAGPRNARERSDA